MPEFYDVVHAKVRDGAEEEMVRRRPALERGVREKLTGLLEIRLVRLHDGTYLDVLRWECGSDPGASRVQRKSRCASVELRPRARCSQSACERPRRRRDDAGVDRDGEGAEAPRVSVRRADDRVRANAGRRAGQRPPRRMRVPLAHVVQGSAQSRISASSKNAASANQNWSSCGICSNRVPSSGPAAARPLMSQVEPV